MAMLGVATLRRPARVAVVLAVGLALSACGTSGAAPTAGGAPSSHGASTGGRDNEADVAFAQGMLIHDRQGVEVAGMAPTRAVSPEVKGLASAVLAVDQLHLATLTGWLHTWGAPVPADKGSGDPAGTGDTASASAGRSVTVVGLLDSEAVIELGNGHGRAWDQLFLQGMSTFQDGALQMAKSELAHGANTDARALARKVIAADSAEVSQIQQLLTR